MEQEQFLQREELVQAHQLGELQKDYTIRVGKVITIGGVIVLFLIIFFSIFAYFAHWDLPSTTIAISIAPVFVSAYLGVELYYFRRLHVYVYTAGLIYWRRKKRRVIRWEQIRREYSVRGNLTLDVNNEPSLLLPAIIEGQDALYETIRRQVVSHRSGQEADQQPTLQPTTSPSEQFGSNPPMTVM